VADLKTTAEERRRVTDAAFAREDMDHRACLAVLDDLDTLLAENAKLRGEVASLALLTNPQAARDAAATERENRAVRSIPLSSR
jgi:hypothetical protein